MWGQAQTPPGDQDKSASGNDQPCDTPAQASGAWMDGRMDRRRRDGQMDEGWTDGRTDDGCLLSVSSYPSPPGSESRSEAVVLALGASPSLHPGGQARISGEEGLGLGWLLHAEKHRSWPARKDSCRQSQQRNSTTHTIMRVVGPEDHHRPWDPFSGWPLPDKGCGGRPRPSMQRWLQTAQCPGAGHEGAA